MTLLARPAVVMPRKEQRNSTAVVEPQLTGPPATPAFSKWLGQGATKTFVGGTFLRCAELLHVCSLCTAYNIVFTALCYAERGYEIVCRLSLRP